MMGMFVSHGKVDIMTKSMCICSGNGPMELEPGPNRVVASLLTPARYILVIVLNSCDPFQETSFATSRSSSIPTSSKPYKSRKGEQGTGRNEQTRRHQEAASVIRY